jgi:ABC-type antimicrobial peptide transport system permease subunit
VREKDAWFVVAYVHHRLGHRLPMLYTIRSSARSFARAPGLSLALLISIALGVGGYAFVSGLVEGLTQPRSPFIVLDRIVAVFRHDRLGEDGPLSRSEYRLIKRRFDVFESIYAAKVRPTNIVIGDQSEVAITGAVTPNLAAALNLPLGTGVMISHRMWQDDFGGSPNVRGHRIHLDHADLPIVGVAPSSLEGLYSNRTIDLWLTMEDKSLDGANQDTRDLWVLARLRQAASTTQAQTALRRNFGNSHELWVTPYAGNAPVMAEGLSRIGALLRAAAGALFFVACVNVISLLLGRALRRSRETSLRIALGATRARLMGELLSDSFVISLGAGIAGILLTIWMAHIIPRLLLKEDAEHVVFVPHLAPIIKASVLCVSITILCGIAPIFATVTDRPWVILQRESGSPSRAVGRLRAVSVASQITTCCVLLICTALLLGSLYSALETNAGERLRDPILVTVQAPAHPRADLRYFDQVEQRAKSAPNVSPLAWTSQLPGGQPEWQSFRIQPAFSQLRDLELYATWLTPEWLRSSDNTPIAGRFFGLEDPECGKEAVIDEDAAEELFADQTVGMVIQDSAGLPVQIIGVIKISPPDISTQKRPTIYYGFINQLDSLHRISHARFRAPVSAPEPEVELNVNAVSLNYFNALGLSLTAGQPLPARRVPGQCRFGVVNQEAADLYFHGNPLGAAIIDDRGVRTVIVGVVESHLLGTFQKQGEPTVYFPMRQDPTPRMTLILQASKWDSRTSDDLRRRIESTQEVAPAVITTLRGRLAQSALAPLRIATLIFGTLASIALALTVLGLFSIQSDAERMRRHELALHIALGAQRRHITLKVLMNIGRLVLVGNLAGALLSLVLSRVMLHDHIIVSPRSLPVWLVAPVVSTLAVVIASVLPAYRACRIDPLIALRDEG